MTAPSTPEPSWLTAVHEYQRRRERIRQERAAMNAARVKAKTAMHRRRLRHQRRTK